MRHSSIWAVPALIGSLLVAGTAQAQISLPGNNNNQLPKDAATGTKLNIKRKTVNGVVKSLTPERKLLVIAAGKETATKDMPIDVGPSIIKAGKGAAKYADIQVGDKITVFGEVTVQGGIRAMEITLPANRMSIPPPAPKTKEEKKKERDELKAKEAAAKAEEAKEEAEKKAAAKEAAIKAKADKAEKDAAAKAEKAEKKSKSKKDAPADTGGVKVDEPKGSPSTK